jgi:hypothetical protein
MEAMLRAAKRLLIQVHVNENARALKIFEGILFRMESSRKANQSPLNPRTKPLRGNLDSLLR